MTRTPAGERAVNAMFDELHDVVHGLIETNRAISPLELAVAGFMLGLACQRESVDRLVTAFHEVDYNPAAERQLREGAARIDAACRAPAN